MKYLDMDIVLVSSFLFFFMRDIGFIVFLILFLFIFVYVSIIFVNEYSWGIYKFLMIWLVSCFKILIVKFLVIVIFVVLLFIFNMIFFVLCGFVIYKF